MPLQPQDSPLGAFLKALREEEIDCILIGAMAAIEQGAPLMTVDYGIFVPRNLKKFFTPVNTIHTRSGSRISQPLLRSAST